MTSTQVMDEQALESCSDIPLAANQSFATEENSFLVNSSFENSPLRSKDGFWNDALRSDYHYLMDDGLIVTCREASSDLSLDDEREISETTKQFVEQLKWLHDLLHNIQVAQEGENGSSQYDQQKVAYLCKTFNDHAQTLCKRFPDVKEGIHCHLNRLNNKWKAVEQSLNPNQVKSPLKDCLFSEIRQRTNNLRKMLLELEDRLHPVNLADNWTFDTVKIRYKEQQGLQKDIEDKGKYISSLKTLCSNLKENGQPGQNTLIRWDSDHTQKVVFNLERRWHNLWLESLECHCVLEGLMKGFATDSDLEKSFSEEPLKKYPRLSDTCEELLLIENELRDQMNYKMEEVNNENLSCDDMHQADFSLKRDEYTMKNDKGVMVGDTGIAELKAECQRGSGKFEIIQDVGYSSETSAHLSNDEKQDSPEAHLGRHLDYKAFLPISSTPCKVSINNQNNTLSATLNKVYLPPDKYPSVSLKSHYLFSDDKSFLNSKYGGCNAVPDSFYKVASVDDEILDSRDVPENVDVPSELLVNKDSKEDDKSKVLDVSIDISHLNLECKPNAQLTEENDLKDFLVKNCFPSECQQTPHSLTKRSKRGVKSTTHNKTVHPSGVSKNTVRVREWLGMCESLDGTSVPDKSGRTDCIGKTADSSCDASCEYTSTESDSEKSNMSDVNNSIAMSQSFTGSIETVIPVVQEESGIVQSDRAGSTDQSSGVRMRKKKRLNRDRPWSVTDVHQSLFSASFPHSNSESALDSLYSVQDSKKLGCKKLSCDNKRLSLTDITSFTSPCTKSFKSNPKSSNIKVNFSSDKLPSRRKKASVSDKGSDKCDMTCSVTLRESLLKEGSDHHLKSTLNVLEDTTEKVSSVECDSLETPLISENEKTESATNVEDQGSISSDQAWDEYQDPPYLSEPYSEQTADEDEVKRLINFGDDYRTMLGSYSDASSISLKAPLSKTHKAKSKSSLRRGSSQESRDSLMSDSNSDSEDFYHVLNASKQALRFVGNTIQQNSQKMNTFSSEFAELAATCHTNLCHLKLIHKELDSGSELESVSKEDILKLQELIKEWEAIQVKLLTQSRNDSEHKPKDLEAATIDVHRSLAALEEKLSAVAKNISIASGSVASVRQLNDNIKTLQTTLSNLQDTKESVLSVSARILGLITEGGGSSITPLKEIAAKLYQQWEDVYEGNCSNLNKSLALQSRWRQPTESEMNSSSETTIHFQPVQVGDNLPTPQVCTEDLFENTAAEVQVADQLDILFEIETDSAEASVECITESEDFSDPIHPLSPPALKTKESLEKSSDEVEASNSNPKRSSFWRSLRATAPLQIALVFLYCMSSLMEPQCCDNMNNYDFSLFPHLRYIGGPPPV